MLKYQKCNMCPCCIGVTGKKATLLLYRVCTMCYAFSVPKRMRNMVTAHEVVPKPLVPPKTPKTKKAQEGRKTQTVKKPRAAPRKRKIDEGNDDAPVVVKKRKPRAPKSEGSSSAKTSPENSVDDKPAKTRRAKPQSKAKPQASITTNE
jgi:hypothetical protein